MAAPSRIIDINYILNDDDDEILDRVDFRLASETTVGTISGH